MGVGGLCLYRGEVGGGEGRLCPTLPSFCPADKSDEVSHPDNPPPTNMSKMKNLSLSSNVAWNIVYTPFPGIESYLGEGVEGGGGGDDDHGQDGICHLFSNFIPP